MMKSLRWLFALAVLTVATAEASAQGRQYYDNSWTYNEINGYYYQKYHYQPVVTVPTYTYHYTVYYPSYPRYVYYYNPHRKVYWGRFEIDDKGAAVGYSLLEEKDRKEKLADIPESAFPKPAAMPNLPDTTEKLQMDPPPIKDLPKDKPAKK